jgi:hypothetical protein
MVKPVQVQRGIVRLDPEPAHAGGHLEVFREAITPGFADRHRISGSIGRGDTAGQDGRLVDEHHAVHGEGAPGREQESESSDRPANPTRHKSHDQTPFPPRSKFVQG